MNFRLTPAIDPKKQPYPRGKAVIKRYGIPCLLFAATILSLGILVASTGFGLPASEIYADAPGIPLTGLQLLFIFLAAGLWIVLIPSREQNQPILALIRKYRLIPILVYVAAVLVWGFTPMLKNYFSLQPAAPAYQPFPYSDARVYDLAAISILRGYGISFYGLPLYPIFLAFLHLLSGPNYILMTWLQILFLALTPVTLFLLGEEFHGAAFGLFLSLVMIVRQRNAIILSGRVSSINPKLFMTEEMTLLGVVLFAYLVFLWLRDRKIWLALLCGGCIGAAALLRLNPLFLFPAAASLVIPAFWRMGRRFLFSHLSAYTLGFLILLVPWLFSSINPQGHPWLFIKLQNVINQRYGSIESSLPSQLQSSLSEAIIGLEGNAISFLQPFSLPIRLATGYASDTLPRKAGNLFLEGLAGSDGIVQRFQYHLVHNFSTSILSMPDSPAFEGLDHLSSRLYWSDPGVWRGNLPPRQVALIFLNLALIAIGLGYSWARHRWAGMIPLSAFIGYSLSLSAAMSSGGRYLTPMDWVAYFYYGLALIALMQTVCKAVMGRLGPIPSISVLEGRAPSPPGHFPLTWEGKRNGKMHFHVPRRKFWFSMTGIVCLSSLVPIVSFVLPPLFAAARNGTDIQATMKLIAAQEKPGTAIVNGEILYPYEAGERLIFTFLAPDGARSYAIVRGPDYKTELHGGEKALLVLNRDAQGMAQVTSLYLWREDNPALIWRVVP